MPRSVDEILEDRVGEERAEEIREENQQSNEPIDISDGSSSSSGSSSGGTTNVPEENIERIDLPERNDVEEIDTGTETNATQSDIGGGGSSGTRAVRQRIDEQGRPQGEPEVIGDRGELGTVEEVQERVRQRRQEQRQEQQQQTQQQQDSFLPETTGQARRELFRREQRQTARQFRQAFGIENIDTTRDFGTIDDPDYFRQQRLEQQANITRGEQNLLETAAQQSTLEQAARRGGEQITGTELGGKIAVGGQSIGTDPFSLIDQSTSITTAVADNPEEELPSLPQRTAEGAPIVAKEFVENPIEEAAPELLDLGFGVGSSVTITRDSTPSFIDDTSTVLGETNQQTNVETGQLTQADVPEGEKVPDLGEQAIGRDRGQALNEPQDALRDPGVRETPAVPQQRGRQPGTPEVEEGFTREEVEVLIGREPTPEDIQQQTETGGAREVFTPQKRVISDPDVDPSDPGVSLDDLANALTNKRRGQLGGLKGPRVKIIEKPSPPDAELFPEGVDTTKDSTGLEPNIIDNSRSSERSQDITDIVDQLDADVKPEGIASTKVGQVTDTGLEESQVQEFDLDQTIDQLMEQGQTQQQTQQQTSSTSDSETFFPTVEETVKPERTFDPTETFTTAQTVTVDPDRQNEDEEALNSLVSSDGERELSRSIAADILGLKSEDVSEEEATNPLSLRPL